MIKLVLTDMDGTLAKDNKDIPQEIFPIYKELLNRGIACGAATGRSLPSLLRDFKGLEDQLTFVAENGAIAYHRGEYIYQNIMSKELIEEVVSRVEKLGKLPLIFASGEKSYAMFASDKQMEEFDTYCPILEKIERLDQLKNNIVKIAIYHPNYDAKDNFINFEDFLENAHVSVSGVEWIDVSMKGVNKGKGVKALQEKLGLDASECMAFGDYLNDREMLNAVEESYAVSNAHPELKKQAKYIIGSNEEAAVIQTLKEKFSI